MSLEVSIECYADDQLVPLFELFASYFQPNDRLLTIAYTRWLYAENPFGKARMVKVIAAERWVGFMAMVPVDLMRLGQRLRAYYVVNVLVHPDFLGKNIFGKMIAAAEKYVSDEGSVLMGHPNNLALKSWRRGHMHFHDTLQPSLVIPRIFPPNGRACDVSDINELGDFLKVLTAEMEMKRSWSLVLTLDYIKWRFFSHPTYTYRIQLIKVNEVNSGILVTRKVRPGINLLIDQFMLEQQAAHVLEYLPCVTIAFLPLSIARNFARFLFLLPISKKIPFFCTYFKEPFKSEEVMYIGLSASDF